VLARATKRPKKCKKYQNQCHMIMCKYRHKAKNVSLKIHIIELFLRNLKITAKSGILRMPQQTGGTAKNVNGRHPHKPIAQSQKPVWTAVCKWKVSGHL
jgi:hypothetical protein